MKKLLIITNSLILSSSTIIILTNNINNYQTVSTFIATNTNQTINWKVLEETTTTYFKNIKKNYHYNNWEKNEYYLIKENQKDNSIINFKKITITNFFAFVNKSS